MRVRQICVKEYFSRMGFKDGNNAKLGSVAGKMLPIVERRLNEEFQRRGLPYRAESEDVSTMHNPVRMSLYWEEGGIRKRWDIECGKAPEGAGDVFEKIHHVEVTN